MTPQIALHIGAHKTATTHLQRSLSEQTDVLAAKGVRYFGPPTFRKGPTMTERFGLDGQSSVQHAQDHLAGLAGPAARVVLSEENFIGALQNRFGEIPMPLYPKAADRISALAGRIAPEGIDVFLGIRNPASFISSAYCQALMGGHKVVLDEVKAKNPISGVKWAELVDRIRKASGVRKLTVWRYEDYNNLFDQIVTELVGADHGISPLPEVVHQGLSTAAVSRILMRYADGKGRQAAVKARARYPVGPDNPAFDAFEAPERAAATAQYDAQVAQIAAMADVRLLKA